MIEVSNKETITMSMTSFWCSKLESRITVLHLIISKRNSRSGTFERVSLSNRISEKILVIQYKEPFPLKNRISF